MIYLPPANEVSKGNVFTGVCLSKEGGTLSRGVSVRETPRTVKSGRYAPYWNAFLLLVGMVSEKSAQNKQTS